MYYSSQRVIRLSVDSVNMAAGVLPLGRPIDGLLCRAARSLLGISQEELCARAGCSRSLLNDFENGARVPKVTSALRIRTALEQSGALFLVNGATIAVGLAPEAGSDRTARARTFASARSNRLADADNDPAESSNVAMKP
jgi:transcriptional regulator with XRE-family HTH domain